MIDADIATLLPVVRRVLADERATIVDWRADPINFTRVINTTGGLTRFSGTAFTDRGAAAWSVVRKVVRPPAAPSTPSAPLPYMLAAGLDREEDQWAYWDREPRLFESGLLDRLPGRVVAPRCYGVERRPDGTAWLWLEHLVDDESAWTLERFARTARDFGTFNGAYLAGEPLPAHPAFSRSSLGAFLAIALGPDSDFGDSECVQWDDPRVAAALPADARPTIASLIAARGRLLDRLNSLPTVFSHLDAHPGNLFTRHAAGEPHRTQRTIAIDWAIAGPGPLGHEPAQIVGHTLLSSRVDANQAAALEDAVLTGYAEGLREAGAAVAVDDLRRGYAAATALQSGMAFPVLVGRFQTEPGLLAEWSHHWGRPADDLVRQWSTWARYTLSLAAEALAT